MALPPTRPSPAPRAARVQAGALLFTGARCWLREHQRELSPINHAGANVSSKLYVAERAADEPQYDGASGTSGDTSQRVDQPDPIADLKMGWRFHTPPVSDGYTIPALVRGVHTHQCRSEGR